MPKWVQLPQGTKILFSYDRLGRTTSVGSDWTDAQHPAVLADGFEFHPSGAVTAVDLGNGTRTTRSFTSGARSSRCNTARPSIPERRSIWSTSTMKGWPTTDESARSSITMIPIARSATTTTGCTGSSRPTPPRTGACPGPTTATAEDRFTGHTRGPESDNEYAAFRYYASGEGRWLGVDPVRGGTDYPQGLNRFAYVINDPVNWVDPDGALRLRPRPESSGLWIEMLIYLYLQNGRNRDPGNGSGGPAAGPASGSNAESAFEKAKNKTLEKLEKIKKKVLKALENADQGCRDLLLPEGASSDKLDLVAEFSDLAIEVGTFEQPIMGGSATAAIYDQGSQVVQLNPWVFPRPGNIDLINSQLNASLIVGLVSNAKKGTFRRNPSEDEYLTALLIHELGHHIESSGILLDNLENPHHASAVSSLNTTNVLRHCFSGIVRNRN